MFIRASGATVASVVAPILVGYAVLVARMYRSAPRVDLIRVVLRSHRPHVIIRLVCDGLAGVSAAVTLILLRVSRPDIVDFFRDVPVVAWAFVGLVGSSTLGGVFSPPVRKLAEVLPVSYGEPPLLKQTGSAALTVLIGGLGDELDREAAELRRQRVTELNALVQRTLDLIDDQTLTSSDLVVSLRNAHQNEIIPDRLLRCMRRPQAGWDTDEDRARTLVYGCVEEGMTPSMVLALTLADRPGDRPTG
jgi:hypothetical protein